jgi:hypothetical protein
LNCSKCEKHLNDDPLPKGHFVFCQLCLDRAKGDADILSGILNNIPVTEREKELLCQIKKRNWLDLLNLMASEVRS